MVAVRLAVVSLLLLGLIRPGLGQGYINPGQLPNGQERYATPLYCSYTSFYDNLRYNQDRSTFTDRNNFDCCYLKDSRNQCCVESSGSDFMCKCSPTEQCGLSRAGTTTNPTTNPPTTVTTQAPTTATPTTTAIPTTTAAPTTTATPTTTAASATTAAPTTPTTATTTTVPTTTTAVPTTATTAPTTATTAAPTTTTTATPTTTTTAATTTPLFGRISGTSQSLCPSPSLRVLNGQPVLNQCTYAGVARINIPTTGVDSCSAVFALTTVNGVTQNAFLTSKGCTDAIALILNDTAAPIIFDMRVLELRFPIDGRIMTPMAGNNGLGYILISTSYASLFNNLGCQTPACPYNAATMSGNIDFNNCRVVSYGASDASTLSSSGLNEKALRLNPLGCPISVQEPFSDYALCFESPNTSDGVYCSGDAGAPVYCKAFSNGEDILMGVTGYSTTCGGTYRVAVIPYLQS